MKILTQLVLSSIILIGATACRDVAKTSADAPDTLIDITEDPGEIEEAKEDATSDIRQAQLNADIRAREQRNELWGDEDVRTNADLQSEVRAKLEANIPGGKLAVEAENGVVTIVGTVPDRKEYQTIEPLAKQIQGVQKVNVYVDVIPPVES